MRTQEKAESRAAPRPEALRDPYEIRPEDRVEPPATLRGALRRIGPGMILAASIVGSGELIATTTLGAEVGYTALWIILLSCFIKPVIQAELGRYTIATGETGLEGFNHFPGPRLRVNWIVWAWAVMVLCTLLQVGAMFGGVAQVLNLLVFRQPQYFSWSALLRGLKPQLPGTGLTTAVAVFGITGVGATELFMYPYWCVEKGYARYAGRRQETEEWKRRAAGWVRVMHVDILASMVIYTVATVAFYVLGAGVLHGMGVVPAANDMIKVLSNIYTQTLGPWSLWLFYAGAIATLYGTIFAATAANSRLFADMFRLMGFFAPGDYRRRVAYRNFFVVFLIVISVILYYARESPVLMVKAGGIAQAVMLPVIGVASLYLRHRRLPPGIAPSTWVTVLLWVSAIVILLYVVVAIRYL